jgi:hypothetical protein
MAPSVTARSFHGFERRFRNLHVGAKRLHRQVAALAVLEQTNTTSANTTGDRSMISLR